MMKLLNEKSISSKLTATPHEQRITHKGMAYFAGTGPRGMSCRECAHWDTSYVAYRQQDDRIKDARCKKNQELAQGRKGPEVPGHAQACKYFEFNPKAPKEYQR